MQLFKFLFHFLWIFCYIFFAQEMFQISCSHRMQCHSDWISRFLGVLFSDRNILVSYFFTWFATSHLLVFGWRSSLQPPTPPTAVCCFLARRFPTPNIFVYKRDFPDSPVSMPRLSTSYSSSLGLKVLFQSPPLRPPRLAFTSSVNVDTVGRVHIPLRAARADAWSQG